MWRDKFKAFTLIEFIIATSIALLLIGASIVVFSKTSGGSPAYADAELLSTLITRARNYAANPEDENAKGYGLIWQNDTTAEIYKFLPSSDSRVLLGGANRISLTGSTMSNFNAIYFECPSGKYIGGEKNVIFTPKKHFFSSSGNVAILTIGPAGEITIDQGNASVTPTATQSP